MPPIYITPRGHALPVNLRHRATLSVRSLLEEQRAMKVTLPFHDWSDRNGGGSAQGVV